ncbi:MAG TPA: MAPEG family protein [Geminicoccus sp.]|jgi:hypothetical protein|uniref:MAPEG family protein n=1 Tax=Geminicoccus sp. TaxID=2024832 RepID=UPI002E3685EA|nr:MAPEG family protein [Geminicoccus sp.]HEX2526212.1 MAPEG family protein [Geminicoccus sp.]
MDAPVTALWAALLAPLHLFLTVRVIRWRRRYRIDMGNGDDVLMERYVRAQANFIETTPYALVLLLLLELTGPSAWLLHGLGLALLAGRLCHAWSFSAVELRGFSRVAGTGLSLSMIALTALLLLIGVAMP